MSISYTVGGATFAEEELAGHIVDAVKKIYSTMIFIDDIADEYPLDKPVSRFTCSISGMIGLGGAFSGMVGVHIPEEFARESTASMLGMEVDELEGDGDINDAIGEITNMLAGEIKMIFSDKGMPVCLSTPSIIAGKDYSVEVVSSGTAVVVPFSRGDHRFLATLQIEG
ncbi:chemotaxis protein CheX [Geobacter pickeringii]|uniref:Chemotaxis protein CheX n=1 Tax=Geobacter pickeringii TaxID=345632 RepID=A0A0B5B6M8_9BACT|nr:chemotaxis protein CheX [Geobacter pickeringii]AJE02197.1 chemotaxis protein CheX [Geobacter pickeringii]